MLKELNRLREEFPHTPNFFQLFKEIDASNTNTAYKYPELTAFQRYLINSGSIHSKYSEMFNEFSQRIIDFIIYDFEDTFEEQDFNQVYSGFDALSIEILLYEQMKWGKKANG